MGESLLVPSPSVLLGGADASGDTLGELQALILARLLKANNLSDLENIETALTNLGFSSFGKSLRSLADVAALRDLVGTYAEIGYAERTTDDTTTNGSVGNAVLVANRITGLAVTVVGKGRPVDIECWSAGIRNSVANSYAGLVLIMDGAQIAAATAFSPNTGVGTATVIKARKLLTAGQSYTFEVGKYGQGGTTTYAAGPTYPMYLGVTQR